MRHRTALITLATAALLAIGLGTATSAQADSAVTSTSLRPFLVAGTKAPVIGSAAHLPDLGTTGTYTAGAGMTSTITGYNDAGTYAAQQAAVGKAALKYLNTWVAKGCGKGCKPAIVFDLDDTTWSWYPIFAANGFAVPGPVSDAAMANCTPALIGPTKAIIDRAVALKVTVFFISGRSSSQYDETLNCLKVYGLPSDHLVLQTPDQQGFTRAVYKNNARSAIEKQGWTIGPNVGDQVSDTTGSHFTAGFLMPNPMYFTP